MVLVIAAIAFIIVPIGQLSSAHDLDAHGVTANGTVKAVSDSVEHSSQMEIVFDTALGRHVDAWTDWDQHSHTGDTVSVRYLPSDPNIVAVPGNRTARDAWLKLLISAALLVLLIIGGIGSLLKRKK